jgi:hypothetical protein
LLDSLVSAICRLQRLILFSKPAVSCNDESWRGQSLSVSYSSLAVGMACSVACKAHNLPFGCACQHRANLLAPMLNPWVLHVVLPSTVCGLCCLH